MSDLIRLQKFWYQKLRDDGFRDIESMDRTGSMDSPMMRQTASSIAANFDPSVEEYYRLAVQFVTLGEFQSQFERYIWALHADGKTYREIVDHLKVTKLKFKSSAPDHPSLFYVQKILRGTRARMFVFMQVRRPRDPQLTLFFMPGPAHDL